MDESDMLVPSAAVFPFSLNISNDFIPQRSLVNPPAALGSKRPLRPSFKTKAT